MLQQQELYELQEYNPRQSVDDVFVLPETVLDSAFPGAHSYREGIYLRMAYPNPKGGKDDRSSDEIRESWQKRERNRCPY